MEKKQPASPRSPQRQDPPMEGGETADSADFDLVIEDLFGPPKSTHPQEKQGRDSPEFSRKDSELRASARSAESRPQEVTEARIAPSNPSPDLETARRAVEQSLVGPSIPRDLPAESWEPEITPPWYRQWSRGWRLGIVVTGVLLVYAVWRGRDDYAAVKAWRGRGLAAKAVEAAERGASEEAARLLDQAGALAPADANVLRALADFNEPRRHPMAIYALAQMMRTGVADASDIHRLCRLALEWGRPELAPMTNLRRWASEPAESLTVEELELGARWLVSRGDIGQAEQRLRLALASAANSPDEPRLNFALAGALSSRASGSPAPARVQEAGARLMAVARSPVAGPMLHGQALESLVDLLLTPEARSVFNQNSVTEVKAELARHLAAVPAESRSNLRLAEVRLDMARHPDQRPALASQLAAEAATAPAVDALRIGRWLNQAGFPDEALSLHERVNPAADDRDWFVCRIDALFAKREWAELVRVLESPDQPLPAVVQALFLYRADRSAGRPEEELAGRREAIELAARSADAVDALYVAGNLEVAGDFELAISMFQPLQRNEQVGLSARLGLVRCLNRFPNRTTELVRALEELVTLWPQSPEARNDLAYLRLLETTPRPDDVEIVKRLVKDSPHFLGFRITAGLAALREGQPAEALRIIDGATIPWSEVRSDWRVVYACVLAANQQLEDARALAATVPDDSLRPGERALLARHLPDSP